MNKDISLQEQILGRLDLSRQMAEEEIKELIDEQIRLESKKHSLQVSQREVLRKEVYRSIRQLGILQELIEDLEVTEVMVNGTNGIFVERKGKLHFLGNDVH